MVLAMVSTSCAHPLAAPTRLANSVRAAIEATSQVVRTECVDERRDAGGRCSLAIMAADSRAELVQAAATCDAERAALDRLCVPLVGAYRRARVTHAALVASLAAAGAAGGVADVLARAAAASVAAKTLAETLAR
jgi:hypothetical protein